MPLGLDIKRKLSARSDRVKAVDLHTTEPWVLCSLYNGWLNIWNFETQATVKTFQVTELPIRTAKFIPRKNWVIAGTDDMHIVVFNYNTMEKVHSFEAHSDYIRSIAVHPTQPYLLSSSDDMTIKLWDWDKNWQCIQVFEGHTHYVMMVTFNPKDTNTFASASLDKTIKVWQLGSPVPNFTLEGHEKGVNCVDYFQGGEKPYLISGADDMLVKVWDYQNKSCVSTLEGHTQNVSVVCFHPELPIILTGSEDGTVRIWHANTYRLENTLNYGMERVWAISYLRGSNAIALGYDEGAIVIKLGHEEPAVSMDHSGKIIWARHHDIEQANVKTITDEIEDGERIPLSVKELGNCEVYPQTLSHNPNGRFVVVCGDGEYTIYTALAWRNKSFGTALEFVWSADSSEYATRVSWSHIQIFRNFKERKAIKPDFAAEGIYGGALLGIRSASFLAFYDWETTELVRRIDIVPKSIVWSDNGSLVAVITEDSFFILSFNRDAFNQHVESKQPIPDEGVESAFDSIGEVSEVVRTGVWVGDCFLYTTSTNRVNYFVGGEVVTLAYLDNPLYLLGYITEHNRVYLADKDLNVVSYFLSVAVLEYQTAVLRQDFTLAESLLPKIPQKQRTRVAQFLEKQGFKEQALAVTDDQEHKFELAMQLKKFDIAYSIAKESDAEIKWRLLGDVALNNLNFRLAEECLFHAKDLGGLLLLFSCVGNIGGVRKLAGLAREQGANNIAFVCHFLCSELEQCLKLLIQTNRIPEAAFFARTYLPSQVSDVVKLWREDLATVNKKAAEALADPMEYENLFPDLSFALTAERLMKVTRARDVPASQYQALKDEVMRNVIEEVKQLSPEQIERIATMNQQQSSQQPQPQQQQQQQEQLNQQQQQQVLHEQDQHEQHENIQEDSAEVAKEKVVQSEKLEPPQPASPAKVSPAQTPSSPLPTSPAPTAAAPSSSTPTLSKGNEEEDIDLDLELEDGAELDASELNDDDLLGDMDA